MNEKLLGTGAASSYQQQNNFHQTIHQSLPKLPKCTKSLSSPSSFWPDHSISSSLLLNSSPQTLPGGIGSGKWSGKVTWEE